MKQLSKIMLKENNLSLKKNKIYKNNWHTMKKQLNNAGFKAKWKNDFDYFQAEVIYNGILNKKAFQNSYEKTKTQLFDLWDSISNNERLDFINRDLERIKHNLIHFEIKDTIIWIPFFDELFNNLFDHSMTIFEHKMYAEIFKEYQKFVIDIKDYNYLPYQTDFSTGKYLSGGVNQYVLYVSEFKRLYLIKDNQLEETISLPLNISYKQVRSCARCLIKEENKELALLLLESDLLKEKTIKKLEKYLSKVNK